jgi:hypothetical protein
MVAAEGDGEAAARLLAQVTGKVLALMQERQDRRKAELDSHRRDVRFTVGDKVLLDTKHTPLPSRSLLSPRWMGPFKVLASPASNTYRLDLPSSWRVFNEFNVDRLSPYVRRPAHLGVEPDPPAPVVGADPGWSAGARAGGAAQVQDALRPAPRPGAVDRPGATPRATCGSSWRT